MPQLVWDAFCILLFAAISAGIGWVVGANVPYCTLAGGLGAATPTFWRLLKSSR